MFESTGRARALALQRAYVEEELNRSAFLEIKRERVQPVVREERPVFIYGDLEEEGLPWAREVE